MKKIQLSNGGFTIIDSEDFNWLSQFRWRKDNVGYASYGKRVNGKYKVISMHRLLNNTPDNLQTDHINRNRLDNRKENLRSVTSQENHFNRNIQSNNTSGYVGVHWNKNREKWFAQIKLGGKSIFLGRFNDIKDAIMARKEAEGKYYVI